jgi:mRNA interferase RelE/StbE
MRWSAVPNWQIELSDKAEATLLRLDKPVRLRILRFLRERLFNHPDPVALAEPLVGEFKGLFRFRVGDYRLISDIQGNQLLIIVVEVRHRGEAYRKGLKK